MRHGEQSARTENFFYAAVYFHSFHFTLPAFAEGFTWSTLQLSV